jgi:thymidine kinase
MFSGKSEELIPPAPKSAAIARQRVKVFSPAWTTATPRTGSCPTRRPPWMRPSWKRSEDVIRLLDDRTQVVGVDEVQFFDPGIVGICERLANLGKGSSSRAWTWTYGGFPSSRFPSRWPWPTR